jgi:hypothetical protein
MDNIKEILESKEYLDLMTKIQKSISIKINESFPPLALINYDLNLLKLAKLDSEKVKIIIREEINKLEKFTIYKIMSKNNEQEYPLAEGPFEKEKLIKVLPFQRDFLFTSIVEFYFLKNRPMEFASFLIAQRIPNAKKYERFLKDFFD